MSRWQEILLKELEIDDLKIHQKELQEEADEIAERIVSIIRSETKLCFVRPPDVEVERVRKPGEPRTLLWMFVGNRTQTLPSSRMRVRIEKKG